MKNKNEIYFSTDVETDGPLPGLNSMLSLGSAAFDKSGNLLDTLSVNFELLPEATPGPDTMKWWNSQPKEIWEAHRKDTLPPDAGIAKFDRWVRSFNGSPVFMAYPAGFDFLFAYWYLKKFTGDSPFSFSALDIKTYAMATLKINYRDSVKRNFPKEWKRDLPKHTHVAVDDAIEQGYLFFNIAKHNGAI